ncbi:type II secretion system protein GspG [Candidatus Omnitrophota bacterium]
MYNNKGRGLIEVVFSIVIVLVLYGVFAKHWIINLREARKVTLENQLTNLKYSLELYKILEEAYPEDIRELNKKSISIKEDSLYGRKYLDSHLQDKEGYPVDPYGRRFIYDNDTGKVKRGSK